MFSDVVTQLLNGNIWSVIAFQKTEKEDTLRTYRCWCLDPALQAQTCCSAWEPSENKHDRCVLFFREVFLCSDANGQIDSNSWSPFIAFELKDRQNGILSFLLLLQPSPLTTLQVSQL